MNVETTCAFTGHRVIRDPIDTAFFERCVQGLIDKGFDTFLCGMAMGFDLLAGETVVRLKKKNPQVKLIACVPCPDQDRYFTAEDKERYRVLLAECDEVKMLSDKFYKGCMLRRDRYMVDNSSVVFGYGRNHKGGTYYTITYAQSKKKRVIII